MIEIASAEKQLPYGTADKIVKFNKTHSDARITVTDYSVYASSENYGAGHARLTTDMLNGLAKPDIVIGSVAADEISQLIRKNLYTDLSVYTKTDDLVNDDNLFGGVRRALSTEDGHLWGLAQSFTIDTFISTKEILGKYAEQESWTMTDLLDFAESLPSDVLLTEWLSQESAAYRLFDGNAYAAFIDDENATCSFTSDEFIRYLNFLASLPADYDALSAMPDYPLANAEYGEYYEFYRNGQIALKQEYLRDMGFFLRLGMEFGTDDYVMIGKPVEKGFGSSISTSRVFVMTSFTEHPETAWEVMRTLMESGEFWVSEIPALKTEFDKLAEEYYNYEFEFHFDGSSSWGSKDPDHPRTEADMDRPGIITYFTPEDAERIKDFLDNKCGTPYTMTVDEKITEIIDEEVSTFLGGQGTAEDCAKKIQSRVGIYLAEHQ